MSEQDTALSIGFGYITADPTKQVSCFRALPDRANITPPCNISRPVQYCPRAARSRHWSPNNACGTKLVNQSTR